MLNMLVQLCIIPCQDVAVFSGLVPQMVVLQFFKTIALYALRCSFPMILDTNFMKPMLQTFFPTEKKVSLSQH